MKNTLSTAALALLLGTATFATAQTAGQPSPTLGQSQAYTQHDDNDHDYGWIGLLGLAGLLGLRRRPETHTVRTVATPEVRSTVTR